MFVFFFFRCGYSLALGLSCFIIVSATMRRWIFPVAVLGMLSVKYTWICVSCVLREDRMEGDWNWGKEQETDLLRYLELCQLLCNPIL
jgi:hypothetical protein